MPPRAAEPRALSLSHDTPYRCTRPLARQRLCTIPLPMLIIMSGSTRNFRRANQVQVVSLASIHWICHRTLERLQCPMGSIQLSSQTLTLLEFSRAADRAHPVRPPGPEIQCLEWGGRGLRAVARRQRPGRVRLLSRRRFVSPTSATPCTLNHRYEGRPATSPDGEAKSTLRSIRCI
jgi:hypothetical protein